MHLCLAGRHILGAGQFLELRQLRTCRRGAGFRERELGLQLTVVDLKQRVAGLDVRPDSLDGNIDLEHDARQRRADRDVVDDGSRIPVAAIE